MNENKLLYHSQVLTDLHSVWTPHPGQIDIGKALFYDNKKRVFVQCGRKFGKQISLDEKILTPNGFIRYGDLSIGDVVYDENGNEQLVTYLSDINYSPESYRVHFCNGTYIDACADHRWSTYTKLDRKAMYRRDRGAKPNLKPSIRTTRDIFQSLMHGKEYNHSIPYAKPVKMKERVYSIDPYLLGCWLGDGGSHGAKITSIDDDILNAFKESYGLTHYDRYDYGILNGFVTKLRSLNLISNKHIPNEYLIGSIDQRLALLQGLMDTDGTINKAGNHCCFDNTNKNLADGVFFLVASLGMKPIMQERVGKIYGVSHKLCYRVQFKPLMNVFRLSRKSNKIIENDIKSRHHTIVKVERIDPIPMRCISVSGPNKLYLIGKSLIPTHNTDFLIYALYRWCLLYANSWCYYFAPFQDQIKDLVWENGRMPNFLPDKLMQKYKITINNTDKRVSFGCNGSFIKCEGADNYEKARGYSATGLCAYDEEKDIHPKFHEGFEPNLAITDAPLLMVGTPPSEDEGEICDRWKAMVKEVQESPVGFFANKPSMTNPHISQDFFIRKRQELINKNEEWLWRKEYLAEIVNAGSSAIFPMLDKSIHVRPYDEIIREIRDNHEDWEFHISFDPGSAKCFAVLLSAVHKYSKKVYCIDEIYADNFSTNSAGIVTEKAKQKIVEIMPEIDRWSAVYDYAATWYWNEYQTNYDFGLFLKKCDKDLKNKEPKLSLIKDMLLGGFIQMSDRCEKLFWEMKSYKTDDNGKIKKENDHLIDNLRYTLNDMLYDKIPSERPLTEAQIKVDHRKVLIHEDEELFTSGDLYADIDASLFDY